MDIKAEVDAQGNNDSGNNVSTATIDPIVAIVQDISSRELYWGNIDFSLLSMSHENGWLEEYGEMKAFMLIGKVHSIQLSNNIIGGCWYIELKGPTFFVKDFGSNLARLSKAFSYNNGAPHFAAGQGRICLERDFSDYTALNSFPEVFDCRGILPSDLNKYIRLSPDAIRRGDIVTCTAFAKGWTFPGGEAGGRFELNAIRLLGEEHKNMYRNAPAPQHAIDI
ncbi:hypothetical protein P7C70_g6699, partial [Phenoliferia sp. Uapishka_3]